MGAPDASGHHGRPFDAVPSGGSGMAGTAEAGFTAADVIVSGDTL